MIKNKFLIMLCRISNDLFALKKCRILHIEYLTSNKKSGIKLLANKVLISKLLPAFLKLKKWGQ